MLRNLILAVLVILCAASAMNAQLTCPGDLTVVVEGSSTDNPLAVSGDPSEPLCNDSSGDLSGSIDLTPSGGTPFATGPEYTYNWTMDGSSFSTDQNLSMLGTGVYAVTVTDAMGCETTGSWSLTEPAPIGVTGEPTDPLCNSASGDPTGEIVLTVVGGTGVNTYSYNWEASNGGTGLTPADGPNQTQLGAGTYDVTVTDTNGCTGTQTFTLNQPDEIAVIAEAVPTTCAASSGDPTGYINLQVQGGTGPGTYTFNWETTDGSGLVTTDQNQSGLSSGTYFVTITDGAGANCTLVADYTLEEPDVVECNLTSPLLAPTTNLLCFGDTGVITVNNPNGSPTFSYTLSGTDYLGNTQNIGPQASNEFTVPAGTYTVTSVDGNTCSSTCDYTLTQPEEFIAGTCTTDDECQVDAGEIEVEAAGGVGPYTVTWTTTTTGATLNPASQVITTSGGSVIFTGAQGGATYIFTVEDENGCIIGG